MSVGAKTSRKLGPKGLAQENWGKSMVIPLYDPPLYDGELLRAITIIIIIITGSGASYHLHGPPRI